MRTGQPPQTAFALFWAAPSANSSSGSVVRQSARSPHSSSSPATAPMPSSPRSACPPPWDVGSSVTVRQSGGARNIGIRQQLLRVNVRLAAAGLRGSNDWPSCDRSYPSARPPGTGGRGCFHNPLTWGYRAPKQDAAQAKQGVGHNHLSSSEPSVHRVGGGSSSASPVRAVRPGRGACRAARNPETMTGLGVCVHCADSRSTTVTPQTSLAKRHSRTRLTGPMVADRTVTVSAGTAGVPSGRK